jgi:hypothetical protein
MPFFALLRTIANRIALLAAEKFRVLKYQFGTGNTEVNGANVVFFQEEYSSLSAGF